MTDTRSESRPAWLTAGVLGIFVVALAAGLVALLVVRNHHANPGLNGSEQAAVDAASRETVNLQSFRLAHFDSDFARATAGLTGGLLSTFKGKQASLKSGLQKSKQDTTATASQVGFKQQSGKDAIALITINNYRVDAKGKKTLFGSGRF